MKTYVVLPTFNEAQNLQPLIRALTSLEAGLRVVVVDDASPDGTGRIADELAHELGTVDTIHRGGKRGLGSAYIAGFRHALGSGADAVITMDCDFSHDPERIPVLLNRLEDADVVIGSRYVTGGEIRNWALHRRLLSRLANAFASSLFALPVRDCTSGFRAYRRAVLERVPWERIYSSGYAFLVEALVWVCEIPTVRVAETPITFVDRLRGRSKLGVGETIRGAVHLPRLRLDLGALRKRARQVSLS